MRADRFRALHQTPPILVLPNAWDAGSARVFEQAGFPALGTTSAGIAFSAGFPDGERIPRDRMLASVARIAAAVDIPVTADMEAGYGRSPADAAATARMAAKADAAGLNLEDLYEGDLLPLDLACDRIRAVREAVPGLVINARTDIYLAGIGDPSTRLQRTIERLQAFGAAGADCVFVPGVTDEKTIGELVRGAGRPLNVLASAGAPPVPRLEALGVARVSVGSGPMRATLGLLQRIAAELRAGTYSAFLDGALPYADANRLFSGHS
jgi:2-methylisocitrate lyase-like PEP mutase family enzyme